MADTSGQPAKPARRRSFWRNKKGATAVEFALVAVPFFGLIAAIVEIGLLIFADSALDTATSNAARLIRTGQAQSKGFDKTAFRDAVCTGITPMFSCAKVKLDVRTSSDFTTMNLANPTRKADGTIDDSGFTYNAGHGTDIVVVRVYYDWPITLNWLATLGAESNGGSRLLSAVTAFRNEPFTW